MVLSTVSSSFTSGYSGSCRAFLDFQLSKLHLPETGFVEGFFLGKLTGCRRSCRPDGIEGSANSATTNDLLESVM
ncbi:hypothetical protein EV2_030516 [Malus domestica]